MTGLLVEWVPFLVSAGIVYYLPGSALVSLLGLRGLDGASRIILSVAFSLIVIPFSLAAIGAIRPIVPTLLWALAISVVLYALVLVRRWRTGGKPASNEIIQYEHGSSRESVIVLLGILLLAAIFNSPRLDMFLAGSGAIVASPSDVYWHLQELVSVARSGIPPRHYLLPDLQLVHYYWSWIYPAAIANSPFGAVSLARTLSLHSFVQIAAFLGVVYVFLRRSLPSRLGRASGIAFVSIFGGFDAFVSRWRLERWPEEVSWLEGHTELSQFVTLFTFAPHHIAGAMAFVLGIYIWRYLRLSWWVNSVLFGIIAAFIFGTSTWVFFGAAIFVFIWLAIRSRIAFGKLRQMAVAGAVILLVFLAGAWRQILVSAGQEPRFGISTFRVPIFEKLMSDTPVFQQIDHWLTVAGFPVIMTWVLAIEIGLPFVLYLLWIFRNRHVRTSWYRATRWFPVAYILLILVVRDTAPVHIGLSVKGIIPAQIIIAMGGAYGLDSLWRNLNRRSDKLLLGYALAAFLIAQTASTTLSLIREARVPVMLSLGVSSVSIGNGAGLQLEPVDREAKPGFPDRFVYIHWLHKNTEPEAVVLEDLHPELVEPRNENFELQFRLLERLRFIHSGELPYLQLGVVADLDLASNRDFEAYFARQKDKDLVEVWRDSEWSSAGRPTYFVSWEGPRSGMGSPIYEDDFVTIYHLDE